MAATIRPGAYRDPVQVDPRHYTIVFENEQVRVLRITYGPKERSVMHGHPSGVAVCLTDHHVRFGLPNGKSEERRMKAGDASWTEGEEHLPENLSDQRLELVLVELKG